MKTESRSSAPVPIRIREKWPMPLLIFVDTFNWKREYKHIETWTRVANWVFFYIEKFWFDKLRNDRTSVIWKIMIFVCFSQGPYLIWMRYADFGICCVCWESMIEISTKVNIHGHFTTNYKYIITVCNIIEQSWTLTGDRNISIIEWINTSQPLQNVQDHTRVIIARCGRRHYHPPFDCTHTHAHTLDDTRELVASNPSRCVYLCKHHLIVHTTYLHKPELCWAVL